MKFLIDQNLPASLAARLTADKRLTKYLAAQRATGPSTRAQLLPLISEVG